MKFTYTPACKKFYASDTDSTGLIPHFMHEDDERDARAQINTAYAHGGGWTPFNGFTMDKEDHSIKYPGDPRMPVLATGKLRDETINVYPYGWVAIVQPDGEFEICRMD